MRSITLHRCRDICIKQNGNCKGKYEHPCTKCPIGGICSLFVKEPINWKQWEIDIIDEDSAAFYKLMKGEK